MYNNQNVGVPIGMLWDSLVEYCRQRGKDIPSVSYFLEHMSREWDAEGARYDPASNMVYGSRMPAAVRVGKLLGSACPRPATPDSHPATRWGADHIFDAQPKSAATQAATKETAAKESVRTQVNRSRELVAALRSQMFMGQVTRVSFGPVISVYDFEPARNVNLEKLLKCGNAIAMALRVPSVIPRMEAGRGVVCFEIANPERETVDLRKLMATQEWKDPRLVLPLPLGRTTDGRPSIWDLSKMPHLLVAGATGSGKSVGLNAIILSLLERHTPEALKLVLLDPKRVELSVYADIPHLWTPIATTAPKALVALKRTVKEMEDRYSLLEDERCRNIDRYNAKMEERGYPPMPRLVVIVDEAANLMFADKTGFEIAICRLAAEGRAAGVHIILATQRPSVKIITGDIKANLTYALAYTCTRPQDSETIIGTRDAKNLLKDGDAILSADGELIRIHGPYVSDEEVERVADELRGRGYPDYVYMDDVETNGARSFDSTEVKDGYGDLCNGDDPVFDDTEMWESFGDGAPSGGAGADPVDQEKPIIRAMRWIIGRLTSEWEKSTLIIVEASKLEPPISAMTLRRAAKRVGVEEKPPRKVGETALWRLG
jgi:DNA segregation ATPase FtsK/SpoIIIE, S-DNA-T family